MKQKKTLHRRVFSAFLAVTLVMTTMLSGVPTGAVTEKQQELENQKKEAQEKLEAAKQAVEQREDNIDQAEALKSSLQTQSELIAEQIELLIQQIADTESKVVEKQDQVNAKQAEIDQRWSDFKDRLAAMQEINDRGGIAIISQATNLYELLTFSETLQDISEKDNEILDEMETERAELDAQRQELQEEQDRLETQQQELSDKKQELAENIQQTDATITAEEAALEADEAAEEAARAEMDAATAALDSYIRQQNAGINIRFDSSLGFISPLPSYKYMSCAYGNNGHKGVDWAAAGGTPIYAAADGVVTIAAYHYSYGNYVQIMHGTDDSGNTFATLYAHMQSWPSVSVGQTVTRGQVIGYVGTTGNSTGNHLHLELRVNGNRTNPEDYIPRPG